MIAAAQAVFDPDVEATLLRVYGLDPQQVTLRRLMLLLNRLPPGEWHKDQGAASWTVESYLLANVIDGLNQVAWTVAQVNSKKKIPQPKPAYRPGHEVKKKKKMNWADFGKALGATEGVVSDVVRT